MSWRLNDKAMILYSQDLQDFPDEDLVFCKLLGNSDAETIAPFLNVRLHRVASP